MGGTDLGIGGEQVTRRRMGAVGGRKEAIGEAIDPLGLALGFVAQAAQAGFWRCPSSSVTSMGLFRFGSIRGLRWLLATTQRALTRDQKRCVLRAQSRLGDDAVLHRADIVDGAGRAAPQPACAQSAGSALCRASAPGMIQAGVAAPKRAWSSLTARTGGE